MKKAAVFNWLLSRAAFCTRLIAAVILLISASAPAAAAQVPAEDYFIFSGVVTRTDNGAPIPNATVIAVVDPPGYPYGATSLETDSSGRFEMYAPWSGIYYFSARSDGYLGKSYPHPIYWTGNVTDINFALDATGIVRGYVYQENGITPVAGATIEVIPFVGGYPESYGVSAADGSFSTLSFYSSEMVTGDYRVKAYAAGYHAEFYRDAPSAATAARLYIAINQTVSGINFSLQRSGSITGNVYAVDSITPLANIIVEAFAPNTDEPFGSTVTTADGSYTINGSDTQGFTNGDYYLLARGEGYQREYYPNAVALSEAVPIHVTAATITPNINFTLQTRGGISGIILQPDGVTPIAGASISIYPVRPGYDGAQIRSQADGTFSTLNTLETDYYWLSYRADGYLAEYYDDVEDYVNATLIPVTAPNVTTGIIVTPRVQSSISGHVYAKDGVTPLHEAKVCAYTSRELPDYLNDCNYSSIDGSYTINDIPSGEYLIGANGDYVFTGTYLPIPAEYYHEKPSLETADWFTLLGDATGIDFTLGWDYYTFLPVISQP